MRELPIDEPTPKAASGRRLTLEETLGRGEGIDWTGTLEAWSWAPDGVHLVRGRGDDAVWIDPATLQPLAAPEQSASADGAESSDDDSSTSSGRRGAPRLSRERREAAITALSALPGVDADAAEAMSRRPLATDADGARALFTRAGALYYLSESGDARELLPPDPSEVSLSERSPDGERVAFVRARDLYSVTLADGHLSAITTDGSPEIYDGELDWVYQEEIYGRGDFKGHWWSPNGAALAFLSLDEHPVHPFTVIDHVDPDSPLVTPEVTFYPKAGDPNPITRLGVWDAESEAMRWVDLSRYADSEPLVVRVTWTPDGEQLLFVVQDRIQTWAQLVAYDLATGDQTAWIHEESKSWVDRPEEPRWLKDGTFLWESERTGYLHLYRYRPGGELVGAVTSGTYEIGRIVRIDEERDQLWFTAGRDGAIDDNTYRVSLKGGDVLRLTEGTGSHRVTPNSSGSLFLDRVSTLNRRPEVRLCDARNGRVLSVLAQSTGPDPEAPDLIDWELCEIPARDGFPLDAAVLKPKDFRADRPHPVWISTYSGPNAPSVRNAWRPDPWFQFLAQEGLIVFQVNVRSASGKGHVLTSTAYKDLGRQELSDLEDAVHWLTAKPWADATRVGITGWSYGGFMTAYALTHSDLFKLGIAGAGVYDWHLYDSIYTERYMSTPQRNPEGYASSSVIAAADKLHGKLVLVHGTKDDNVHLQNTIRFIYALEKAGMDFEMMLYPESRHGISDAELRGHLRGVEWGAIRRHLMSQQ